ncbi:MAG TPA: GspE/PulE family protein [Planctomycetota bacterium]|nr:GspE/PulE family protein [Planctomycetota bacterium]
MADATFQAELDRRWSAGADGVPALVDWLLAESARRGASDLHLEPRADDVLLRWRRDGCLVDAGTGKGPLRMNVVQRVKVLAGLLTYRTDIPQDGRIAGSGVNGVTDMRVSIYPAALGEKAVIRFFHGAGKKTDSATERSDWTLEQIGLSAGDVSRLAGYLIRPQGMILLTGPAGSGKTTTLYAALKYIVEQACGQRQIVTIEDPVERLMPGVTHTELRPAAGLDYPAALKALLRQDPEVIMIGEIRDGETAQVSVQAALTGHLILSTVHAPTAPEVLLRLLHLGVEPYMISSVISAVIEQRLVRRLCECRKAAPRPEAGAPAEPFVANGCERCGMTGYKGRMLIAELLPIEGALRTAVLARKDSMELMNAAAALGWRGLFARGSERVAEGLTTFAELRRVLAPA